MLSLVVILTASFVVVPALAGPVTSRNGYERHQVRSDAPHPSSRIQLQREWGILLTRCRPSIRLPCWNRGHRLRTRGFGLLQPDLGSSGLFHNLDGELFGRLSSLSNLDSGGGSVHFFVNVTVPSRNTTAPFPAGAYEFWSLENYTKTPTCANYPFTLTATPPPSIGCLSWSAQLRVTSLSRATERREPRSGCRAVRSHRPGTRRSIGPTQRVRPTRTLGPLPPVTPKDGSTRLLTSRRGTRRDSTHSGR